MSVYVATYVWQQSKQKGSNLVVMLALADYANEDTGECWPGITALAEKSRMTTRYLRTILNRLEKDGEIKRFHGAGKQTETGATNRYIICGYQAWIKQVKAIKANGQGVNNDSPHSEQGVNNSSARGEQEFREGVNNDSPKPLVKPSEKRQKESASNDATAIAAIIKAWHDDAKVIEAGNPYQKTGYRKTAQAMHEAGITPADVTAFMNARRSDPFWRDKGIAIGAVAKDIAAWKTSRQPARSQLPEHRIVTTEELEVMAGQRQPHELTPNEDINNAIRDLANILRAPGSKTA